MKHLRQPFQDGFILTGPRLEAICSSLSKQMGSIADSISTSFKLKYVSDIEVDRPDFASVLREENGGKKAIKKLTVMLRGTKNSSDATLHQNPKNNVNTASIDLTFAIDIVEPIVYDITSSDEAWFDNTLPLLDSLIKDTIKQSTSRNMRKLGSQVSGISKSGFIPLSVAPFLGELADVILSSLGKSFISSDYVFLWGDAINVLNQRQDIIKNIIQVIVVAIFIGLLVGIAAGLIANYITIYLLRWH